MHDTMVGITDHDFKIIPYMVTNKVFESKYKNIAFPIVSFSEMKDMIFAKNLDT